MTDIPYVKECLAVSGSVLAARKKKQQSASPDEEINGKDTNDVT